MGCGSCGEEVGDAKGVRCCKCWLWFHLGCTDLNKLPAAAEKWYCVKCINDKEDDENRMQAILTMMTNFKTQEDGANSIFMRRQALKKLPKFSGNCKDWPRFKAIFDQSTSEGKFSNIENANRLIEAISGTKAVELVGNILINPENIDKALDILELHFGDKDAIYECLIDDLLNFKILKINDRESIISYSTAVANVVANLNIMNMESRFVDARLVRDLVAKLPANFQEKWIEFVHEKNKSKDNLNDFNEFLEMRVKILIELRSSSNQNQNVKSSTNHRGNIHLQNEAAGTKDKKCIICKSDQHKIYKCPKFIEMSIQTRWNKVKEFKLCFSCLHKSHRTNQCRFSKFCNYEGCKRKHNQLLHSANSTQATSSMSTDSDLSADAPPFQHENKSVNYEAEPSLTVSSKNNSMFMILPVTLYANNKSVDTHVFLDYGSAFSLLDASLADKLNLKGTPASFSMVCAKENIVSVDNSIITSVKIAGKGKSKQYTIKNVRTVENLGLPISSLNAGALKLKHPFLASMPLPSYENVRPMLMIGINNPTLLSYDQKIERSENSPVAVRTKLGWCIFGKENSKDCKLGTSLQIQDPIESDNDLHDLVKNYFSTESFGCKPDVKIAKSKADEKCQQIVSKTLKHVDNHYEVGLLWKSEKSILPNNYDMAFKRLLLVEHRMKKDPELELWYKNQINENKMKGYCKVLQPDEIDKVSQRIWYIPFFHVINQNKCPPKKRLVFDAAAKFQNKSLNSELLTGPNIYVPLPAVIFKSRENNICVAADIREMFPQVKIRDEDQVAQRFLWRDGNKDNKIEVHVMTSMIFGASCSPYLAQTVKNENALKFVDKYPEAVKVILEQHYVDDYINSHTTADEAIKIAKQVIDIHKNASFELRGFVSNSIEVRQALPQSDQKTKQICLNQESEDVIEKMLGVYWNIETDCFEFKVNFNNISPCVYNLTRPPTKRELLRIIMSIFDPIGLLSHVLVRARVLIQETWRSGIGWDEELTDVLFNKWCNWINNFKSINNLKIPRLYTANIHQARKVEMHTFVDASEKAFCAVIYFRIIFNESIKLVLVTSKAKVAPTKVLSIPRLELQAAVLGSRLADAVERFHRIKVANKYFWSDSNTVLSWIKSEDPQKFKSFISVRIGEIQELSNPCQWRKVSSKANVADDGTKWFENMNYSNDDRWFKGPDFLLKDDEEWLNNECEGTVECLEERKPVFIIDDVNVSFSAVPVEKYSSFFKLRMVMSYVVKFITNCRNPSKNTNKLKILSEVKANNIRPILSYEDIQQAENLLIKVAQYDAFKNDYLSLLNKNSLPV